MDGHVWWRVSVERGLSFKAVATFASEREARDYAERKAAETGARVMITRD